ncbi:MarR family transcriptional regulator [Bacillus cytotoxicus]|uniref:Uncharacterized HTH-type transcriptional regulator yvmB n=2 Tax=Bacillus cytotoxicus TaxID=580165 RepID=A0AAX2CH68_9BACI|nr:MULTISPECIES: MarR family transcriptional regulator [Bacillus cereus group]ABS22212.1 transcriptional regulator, MarR family [Bacillus cytotoxicus NVH 391-98]AWC28829.1 MarR family transcriptional regulator [Bacillus cytotoxicus]AWC32834.1 MarR family transcriptional regulator [Bacillus cytotoxicus]AWC36860.1 MarR family transcriptional regulator [Bacillus cytotoxicus]AWC39786.1 MarR family transcriptional regulator [Bacillus cytotoxicus]
MASAFNNDKNILIKQIVNLTGELAKKWGQEEDEEREWLLQNCKNPHIATLLKEVTVKMLHVLDAIGKHEPVNGITIASETGIPKGSVSKMTRRLMNKNLIVTETIPNNKKEILFKTTSLGKELFHLHQALHQEINKGVVQFLSRYTQEELQFVTRFLSDTLEASWVTMEENLVDENKNHKG